MSFAKLLDDAAIEHPGRNALIDGDRSWTYAELKAESRRVARGLAAAGVQPGDRVALHMTNRAELAALYFACARLGAVAVPIKLGEQRPHALLWVAEHEPPVIERQSLPHLVGKVGARAAGQHGIDAETYTMWIVPERLAEALGPAGLERALREGLNGPRSALFAPR